MTYKFNKVFNDIHNARKNIIVISIINEFNDNNVNINTNQLLNQI